jgi:hypothetical protein
VAVNGGTFIAGLPGSISAFIHHTGPIIPTGTIQFLDGGVPLGALMALDTSGAATIQTTFQNEGTHSFSANYSGDAIYNAGVAAPTPDTVVAPFEMVANGTQNLSATVPAGQTAFYNISVVDNPSGSPTTPNNFSGTVTFSCSGLPAGSTCTFTPPSIALTPTQAFSFTVGVTTSASASLHKFPFRGLPVVFAGVLALAISLKSKRKHTWQAALVLVFALGISSCGGGGSKTVTTPVLPPTQGNTNATVVVTATSGTHTSIVNLQLTITH